MLIAVILAAFVILGVVGIVVLTKTGGDQKKAEANAGAILDAAFNGQPDVTFSLNMRTLKYETVMAGARQRGYRLVDKAENQYGPHTLIFEKVA